MKKNILINIRIDPVLKSNFQDIKNDIYVVMSLFLVAEQKGFEPLHR
jgi:antitoxin component of RelBE/YafQ-DinJ toxin-antitoxin module